MRRKIKLAYIENNNARKASFKKRSTGLMKKLRELTTLCDISACIIIYSPENADSAAAWPNEDEARHLIRRFLMVPEVERCKKMVSQEGYLKERTGKMSGQVQKLLQQNKEMVLIHSMREIGAGKRLADLGLVELKGVKLMLEQKMKEVDRKRELIRLKFESSIGFSSLPPPSAEELAGGRDFSADWMVSGAGQHPLLPDQNWDCRMFNGISSSGGNGHHGFQILKGNNNRNGNRNEVNNKTGFQPYINGASGGKSNIDGKSNLGMIDDINFGGNYYNQEKRFGGDSGGFINLPNTTNFGANFDNAGFGFVPSGFQDNSSGSGSGPGMIIGESSGTRAIARSGDNNNSNNRHEFSYYFGKYWPDLFSPTP